MAARRGRFTGNSCSAGTRHLCFHYTWPHPITSLPGTPPVPTGALSQQKVSASFQVKNQTPTHQTQTSSINARFVSSTAVRNTGHPVRKLFHYELCFHERWFTSEKGKIESENHRKESNSKAPEQSERVLPPAQAELTQQPRCASPGQHPAPPLCTPFCMNAGARIPYTLTGKLRFLTAARARHRPAE